MGSDQSQRSEPFTEPSREKIVEISRHHVAALEASDDDSVWILAGMNHVVLTTIGRRSGATHKVALPFWQDSAGCRVVVASYAGADKHPAWFLNLSDRTANPTVQVRVQGGRYEASADVLTGEDYDEIWAALIADRPHYANYQTRTSRQIPLVRLVPLGSEPQDVPPGS